MSNLQYIAANLVENASAITVSTENATYVKANLYNRMPSKPFMFTDVAGNIVIDFGAATSISGVAILDHNIDAGATVTLEAHTADAWGAPSESEAVSITTLNMFKIFSAASYRYWRLVVSGAAANVKIGELVLGVAVELTQNYNWSFGDHTQYKNVIHETDYLNTISYRLSKRDIYELSFLVNDTTRAEIKTLLDAVNGNALPFVIINYDGEAKYVRGPERRTVQRQFTNRNGATMTLTEVARGITL